MVGKLDSDLRREIMDLLDFVPRDCSAAKGPLSVV